MSSYRVDRNQDVAALGMRRRLHLRLEQRIVELLTLLLNPDPPAHASRSAKTGGRGGVRIAAFRSGVIAG